jgi:hypothetical protein
MIAAMKWKFTGFDEKHKVHEAKINITNQIDDTKEKLLLKITL